MNISPIMKLPPARDPHGHQALRRGRRHLVSWLHLRRAAEQTHPLPGVISNQEYSTDQSPIHSFYNILLN